MKKTHNLRPRLNDEYIKAGALIENDKGLSVALELSEEVLELIRQKVKEPRKNESYPNTLWFPAYVNKYADDDAPKQAPKAAVELDDSIPF